MKKILLLLMMLILSSCIFTGNEKNDNVVFDETIYPQCIVDNKYDEYGSFLFVANGEVFSLSFNRFNDNERLFGYNLYKFYSCDKPIKIDCPKFKTISVDVDSILKGLGIFDQFIGQLHKLQGGK